MSDFEASVASAEAFLYAASIMLPLRRLGRCRSDSRRALMLSILNKIYSYSRTLISRYVSAPTIFILRTKCISRTFTYDMSVINCMHFHIYHTFVTVWQNGVFILVREEPFHNHIIYSILPKLFMLSLPFCKTRSGRKQRHLGS